MRVPNASLPSPESPSRTGSFAWRKYVRYVLTGLAFMYAFKALDTMLEETPLMQRFERANLDALFSARTPEVSKDIFIIDVTEDDYDQLFGGISPLDPAKMYEIIQAIVESGPKVLGVDFDTSGWKDVAKPNASGAPVVWARAANGKPGNVTLADVLGGSSNDVCYGIPAYVPNDDGFVRQYAEYIKGADLAYPTLPVNLADIFLNRNCRKAIPVKKWKQPDTPPLINYSGDKSAFSRLSAGALLQLKGPAGDAEAAPRWDAWKRANPIKGKLALFGGAYRAARDAYPTPVGYLDGVDILAHTAQTRLPGHELLSAIRPGFLNNWFSLQGYLLLLLLYFVPKAWRMGVTILTGPVYAFAGNWIWFFAGGTFLSFVPYLEGLVVHQIYDHIKEFRKVEKENRELKEKLRELGSPVPEPAAEV
ncbi:MAG TPA: CHASE2 domain-containing protein [Bryobacteraceae bacterium]